MLSNSLLYFYGLIHIWTTLKLGLFIVEGCGQYSHNCSKWMNDWLNAETQSKYIKPFRVNTPKGSRSKKRAGESSLNWVMRPGRCLTSAIELALLAVSLFQAPAREASTPTWGFYCPVCPCIEPCSLGTHLLPITEGCKHCWCRAPGGSLQVPYAKGRAVLTGDYWHMDLTPRYTVPLRKAAHGTIVSNCCKFSSSHRKNVLEADGRPSQLLWWHRH